MSKLCKDCKWCRFQYSSYYCSNPKNITIDPVTGKDKPISFPAGLRFGANSSTVTKYMYHLHSILFNECGPNARWFEPIPQSEKGEKNESRRQSYPNENGV